MLKILEGCLVRTTVTMENRDVTSLGPNYLEPPKSHSLSISMSRLISVLVTMGEILLGFTNRALSSLPTQRLRMLSASN